MEGLPMFTATPTESNIFTALGGFLAAVLPAGTPILQGQVNRVAEPASPDFVVMWPILRPRISTNVDSYLDAVFTGAIADTLMTITAVNPAFYGQIGIGSRVFGVGVAANTIVSALGTGAGGVGTYTVTPSQSVGSETLATGTEAMMQATEIIIQVDVHGPNGAGNAQTISTTFRDDFAVQQFKASDFDVTPLYTDDPQQLPFLNEAQQWEDRWTVDVHMQANIGLSVPMQFAGTVDTPSIIDVDSTYSG
jgi:hypothetical protein